VAGAALILLSTKVLSGQRPHWAAFGWGLVASVGMWSDMLVAPFVAGSGIVLWRARRGGLALAAGLLAGPTPVLVHGPASTLTSFLHLYAAGGSGQQPGDPGGQVHRLANTILISLPYATGGSALGHHSDPPAWPTGWSGSWHPTAPSLRRGMGARVERAVGPLHWSRPCVGCAGRPVTHGC
jgi:hypothetical protein